MVFLFASCGLVSFFVVLCPIFVLFSHSFQKNKTRTQQKKKQNQKWRKTGQTNSVTAVVFTKSVPNFWGVGYKNAIFAESPIEIRVQHILRKEKRDKNVNKVASKSGQG